MPIDSKMDLTVRNINEGQRQHELKQESDNFAFNPAMNGNKEASAKQVDTDRKENDNRTPESSLQHSQHRYKEVTMQSFHGLQYADLSQSTSHTAPSFTPDFRVSERSGYYGSPVVARSSPDILSHSQEIFLNKNIVKQDEMHTASQLENTDSRSQVLDEAGNPVRRPMNAFMIWSKEKRQNMAKEYPKMHNAEISKHLGMEWRSMSDEDKKPFLDKAKDLRTEHMRKYPNYRYTPRRKIKSQQRTATPAAVKLPHSMTDPRQQYPPYLCRPMLYTAGYPTTAGAVVQSAIPAYPRFPQYLPQYYAGFGSPYPTQQRYPASYMWNQATNYNPSAFTSSLQSNVQPPRRCASVSSSYTSGSEYSYPSLSPSPTFSQPQSPQGASTMQQTRPISPISSDESPTANMTESDLGEMINIYLPENDV